ncbi:MAG: MBL fold metallo-hydrolase [Clostridia bacterium]|nr:MBL fold metallo-hydrolase [Clostridia bacterium]
MARFCPLASSSSGNSTYVSSGKTALLIDAGISYKSICERVAAAGGDIGKIAAVAVTHSHDDHICGLKTLLKKTGAPLYATKLTVEELIHRDLIPPGTNIIYPDTDTAVFGDIEICRFKTSHDAPGSCGYRLELPSGSCAVCTDLGIVTDEVRAALKGCDLLLFESNHDIDMLKYGPYRPQLKIRILSDLGHLSNTSSAAEIPFFLASGTKQIILGHLSRHNNTPALALSAAETSAELSGAKRDIDYLLSVAAPGMSGVSVF